MSHLSITDYVSKLTRGLEARHIDFVISEEALGCNITEIFITEAQELIIFPMGQLDVTSIQWILHVRTPLNIHITFFSTDCPKLETQLLNAVKKLKEDGIEILRTQQEISIQELSENNIKQLLDSLENWMNNKTNRKPFPDTQTSITSSKTNETNAELNEKNRDDLHIHLRNAIKTYWTERYFARYMNLPSQKLRELAERIGIQHEVCGQETLYFFNRKKALETYFEHVIKGILDELKLKYHEPAKHDYYLPELHLRLYFFGGEKIQPRILTSEYVQNRDLILITPEAQQKIIRRIQDDIFLLLPLDQDKIKGALIKIVRQRIDYIPAYSSGVIQ
jgi:hypothetical protein